VQISILRIQGSVSATITTAKIHNKFSRESPYIANTFSRKSPRFQTSFHVSKRSPHHSKDLPGNLVDLEIHIFESSSPWADEHCYDRILQSHTLQHTATHCNTLQHTATHCNTPSTATKGSYKALHYYTLQHAATHCNTLTYCNILQYNVRHCFDMIMWIDASLNRLCKKNLMTIWIESVV